MSAALGPALGGIRVLDLTDASGCYGTKALADLGVDVIRVEPPGGDPLRARPPFLDGVPGPDRGLYWASMNTSKRSLVLDLDQPDGRRTLDELAGWVDVICFSGPATRYDELGLDRLRSLSARLVVASVTPFGLTGPMRSWAGSDLVAWAMGGLARMGGDPDQPPLAPAPAAELAHVLAGQFAALSTLAAVRLARRTGKGQLLDLSLQESVTAVAGESGIITGFLDDLVTRARSGSRRATTAPFGHYPASDGYAVVMAPMPAHWKALRDWAHETTGDAGVLAAEFEGGPQSRAGDMADVVNVYVEDHTRRFGRQQLFMEGQKRGIPVTPVNDAASVLADPQLEERGFWRELDIDSTPVRAPGPPYRLARCPWHADRPPTVGEHTGEVLRELAEWSESRNAPSAPESSRREVPAGIHR